MEKWEIDGLWNESNILQSWTKLLMKLHIAGAILQTKKKASTLGVCTKQRWVRGVAFLYLKPVIWRGFSFCKASSQKRQDKDIFLK